MNTTVLIIASLLGCFGGLALLGSAGYGLFAFFKQPAVAGAPTPAEISLHKTGRNLLIVAVVLFLMTCCCLPLATFGANLLFGDNNTSPNSGYNAGELPVQPANCGQLIAIDPKNPTGSLTAPAGSIVLTELVDNTTHSIVLKYFTTNEPITAYTNGNQDFNIWYGYCDLSSASTAALMQKRERETETWFQGYDITIVGNVDASSSSCSQNVIALDPAFGDASTPAGVYVVTELVNYSAHTIEIRYFYTDTPVYAYIQGQTHQNVWYGYCDLESAHTGALAEKRERSSETLFNGYDITIK